MTSEAVDGVVEAGYGDACQPRSGGELRVGAVGGETLRGDRSGIGGLFGHKGNSWLVD
jgi:hypothetical protein